MISSFVCFALPHGNESAAPKVPAAEPRVRRAVDGSDETKTKQEIEMASYEQSKTTPGTTAPDGTVAMNETDRLIASDKVEGTPVYSRSGESLGTVYNFMVDKTSGKVAYAVMSFGGFLGIGERYHALPWDKLNYDPSMSGYVLDIDREKLEGAPHYGRDETPWSDPNYGRNVYDYYGVPYYF
jgi:sporulation protein YlmC with PRC-barrel domain